MGAVTGKQMRLLIGANELKLTRDLRLPHSVDEIDMSSRAGEGFKQFERGLIAIGLEGQCIHDPDDTAVQALIDAALDGSSVVVKFGTMTESPLELADGWKFNAKFFSESLGGPLTDGSFIDFTLKPDTTAVPERWRDGSAIT